MQAILSEALPLTATPIGVIQKWATKLTLIYLKARLKNSVLSPVYIWPTSSEPGLAPSLARCLAPIRACLHYRGRAPCQRDHQYAAALNLRHVGRVLIAFLQFRRYPMRWLVCNNYESSNLKKLFDVALFVILGAIIR